MHGNIIEAINKRDAKAAKAAMRIHLDQIGSDVRDGKEEATVG